MLGRYLIRSRQKLRKLNDLHLHLLQVEIVKIIYLEREVFPMFLDEYAETFKAVVKIRRLKYGIAWGVCVIIFK